MSFAVRPISSDEHLAFIADRTVSFLQTPAWAIVKNDWRGESLGWFDGSGTLIGAGLVLYRKVPRLRRYLAYLPEGPSLDWTSPELPAMLRDWVRSRSARRAR